jgi:3-oxoacyl-[acyl-carrier protein] reductase
MPNVIVTGGSRGLGLGSARKLTADGFQVIAIARQKSDQLASAMAEARCGQSGSIHFKSFDFYNIAGIPDLVKELRNEFGPIYGLVNNAGIGTSGVLATMRDAQIAELVAFNIVSPLTLTKYVVRSMMVDGGGGRIVNIASIAAATGYNGLSVYSSSKAALVGFTRSLAREIGPLKINVNAVAPGFVDTDLTRGLAEQQRIRVARQSALRHLVEIDDIANAVAFLFSDKAKNITGTVLTVDAGTTA